MATRPVGRPALAAAQKRTAHVMLRFSPEEAAELDRAAQAAGLQRAVYCRRVVLGVPLRRKVDRAARLDLNRIGVNLNQLAYHANATGRLQELQELRSVLEAIRSKVAEL